MNLQNYQFSFGVHSQKNVIWIKFPNLLELKQKLKKRFPSAKWSQTQKAWYLPDLPSLRILLNLPDKEITTARLDSISSINQIALQQYINQLKLKAYSQNTIRLYVAEFTHLLQILKNHSVNDLTPERLKDYFLYCLKIQKNKEESMNSKINAIKFYYEQVLHRPKMFFDIPRPKLPQKLPKVLTKAEVKKLFATVKNSKHLLMLQLCYGMGLRVSEIVKLKVEHFNSESMRVHIAGAKGKKDRYTHLPDSILPLLRAYYLEYKPKNWLFEGQYGGVYSIRSVQAVFKNAMDKASINKSIGIHGLRHSYATHLIESGADIRFIKELLGHQSITTTQIYTQVTDVSLAKIKSPLDSL